MNISFISPCTNNISSTARITNIEQVINPETNNFNVFAKPDSGNSSFRPGMSIDVKLILDDVKVLSIPNKAIIRSDYKSYVFIKESNLFTRIYINTGNFNNDYTEIIEIPKELIDAEIVIFGVQYLNDRLEE